MAEGKLFSELTQGLFLPALQTEYSQKRTQYSSLGDAFVNGGLFGAYRYNIENKQNNLVQDKQDRDIFANMANDAIQKRSFKPFDFGEVVHIQQPKRIIVPQIEEDEKEPDQIIELDEEDENEPDQIIDDDYNSDQDEQQPLLNNNEDNNNNNEDNNNNNQEQVAGPRNRNILHGILDINANTISNGGALGSLIGNAAVGINSIFQDKKEPTNIPEKIEPKEQQQVQEKIQTIVDSNALQNSRDQLDRHQILQSTLSFK